MRHILLILLLSLAQWAVGQTLTLDEARRLARDNYPLIKRYDIINSTGDMTLSNINKAWLPQLQADAQATYQSAVTAWPDAMKTMLEQLGSDMKGLKKDQYRVGVSVNQQVYDGGATASRRRTAQATTLVETAQNDVELYKLNDLVDQVYFGVLLADERLRLNHEHQATLKANEDRLQAMNDNGTATQSDVNAMRAERLGAVQEQMRLETSRASLLRMLSLYTGSDVTAVVRPAPPTLTTDAVRPELTLFSRQQSLLDTQQRGLKASLMPTLSVFAQGYYGYPGYNMFKDMMSHKWSWNGMIGAKVTWNIGSLYTHRNDKATLRMQRDDVDLARETFLLNQRLQSAQEQGEIDGYRRVIEQDDEIVRLRHRVRLAEEAKLQHGVTDVNALVQEISRENQAAINKQLHELELLQHLYALKNIGL